MSTVGFQEILEGWLAKAANPAHGMEAELQLAREKLKQLVHTIKEEKKISELREQEQNAKIEMLEKLSWQWHAS